MGRIRSVASMNLTVYVAFSEWFYSLLNYEKKKKLKSEGDFERMNILKIQCGKVYLYFSNADSLLEDIVFAIGFLKFMKRRILKE